MPDSAYQQCINADCSATSAINEAHFGCPRCGDLLDVRYEWGRCRPPKRLAEFEGRWATRNDPLDRSGVWRFRELLDFAPDTHRVTIGEGQTLLQQADALAAYVRHRPGRLFLQYEGLNPSGSFKDNGMAAAFTHAKLVGATRVACASTGNTSASVALFASVSACECIVFIGSGKIAFGKLSQALDYGARTIQVRGDFDACMRRVRQVVGQLDLYLMNSVNPFRLEGQKTIIYRVLEGLGWEVPDWVIVPGGNLGNSAAFGKAFAELHELGLIDRVPRLAIINATGANTLFDLYENQGLRFTDGRVDMAPADAYYAHLDATGYKPHTIASAIEISRPVNLKKALRSLAICNGLVRQVCDEEILDAKAQVGRTGLGCEPASAASVAGLKLLRQQGVIEPGERVVCILTGHLLKDPSATVDYHTRSASAQFANPPRVVDDELDSIIAALGTDQPNPALKGTTEATDHRQPASEY